MAKICVMKEVRCPPSALLYGILLTAILLAGLSLFRHIRLASTQDLAMVDQMLWNLRHGAGLWTTMSGNSALQYPHHYFSEHLSPILYLLAWPVAWGGAQTLLVLQALAIAGAAWPLAWLAQRWLGSRRAGIVAGMAWLLQPALYQAALYDFHIEALEAFFLFAFVAAFLANNPWHWLWAALYAACKEDAPLYLAALSAILGWQTGRWRAGCVLSAVALAYGCVASCFVIPSFSPTGKPLLLFRLLTPASCGGIAPWLLAIAADPSRWQALAWHVGTFAFLPLCAGLLTLPAAMVLGVMWLSNDLEQSHLMIHYPLTFFPLLALAALAGARNILCWRAPIPIVWKHITRMTFIFLGLVALCCAWFKAVPRINDVLGAGATAPLRESRRLLDHIPPGEPVTAALTLAPHLAQRSDLRILMAPSANTPWLVTRLDGQVYPCSDDGHHLWLQDQLLATSSRYGLVAADEHVAIFRRDAPTTDNAELAFRLKHTIYAENFHHRTGQPIADALSAHGIAWQCKPRDPDGPALFGRYLDLPAGEYEITFRLRGGNHGTTPYALLDVTEANGRTTCAEYSLKDSTDGYRDITLKARLTDARAVEFRVFKVGRGEITVDRVMWRKL